MSYPIFERNRFIRRLSLATFLNPALPKFPPRRGLLKISRIRMRKILIRNFFIFSHNICIFAVACALMCKR